MKAPPFGAFRLRINERFSRKAGARLGRDPASRFARTILKSIARINARRPRDVSVFATQKARLHPYDNICEKRVFLTPHLWEPRERAAVQHHIATLDKTHLHFIDAGANVGLFTLFARHCAAQSGKIFAGVCIEPGEIVRARLEFNLAASGASEDVQIFPIALSDKAGVVDFHTDTDNLGESRIPSDGAPPTDFPGANIQVNAVPLLQVINQAGFARIDILKIDIEGQELRVLKAFFRDCPRQLYPALMIMEIAHAKSADALLALCTTHGYTPYDRSRGNVVLKLARAPMD